MQDAAVWPVSTGVPILTSKLATIESLWEKLVHVRWSGEALALLGRLTADLVQAARAQEVPSLIELADQLEHQVSACVATGAAPCATSRDRLAVLLEALRAAVSRLDAGGDGPAELLAASTPRLVDVLVADAACARQLLPRLRAAGFRVRHLTSRQAARAAHKRVLPDAMVVDADLPGIPGAGIDLVQELRDGGRLQAPVFFLSARGDVATRIAAVRAGGAGYFTKPLDLESLLDRLACCIGLDAARGYRVLIVDDEEEGGKAMARMLERRGMVTRAVSQPLQVMESLQRFQPDLLLLDLNLEGICGMELAQVIRQHEDCHGVPMLLLSDHADLSLQLSALGAAGDELLIKPVREEHLLSAVTCRLRRSRALSDQLRSLGHRDPVSGLFTHDHFLELLEHAVSGIAPRRGSVGVMLITLDNLHTVRHAVDLLAADELLELAARRLQTVLGRPPTGARLGESVFGALLTGATNEDFHAMASRVQEALEGEFYQVTDHTIPLRTSIGVSVVGAGDRDFPAIIQQADLACTLARETRRERIYVHDSSADSGLREVHRRRLLEDIRDAVESERMGLVFQPIASLRGDQSERYEVFLRMRNAQDQELLPETVFTVAQGQPLGTALDRWVIAQSLGVLRERQSRGRSTTLFVNVSLASLQDPGLHSWLGTRLEDTGVQPRDLVFDVSEATARKHARLVRRFAAAVTELGCGFALEHFGNCGDPGDLLRRLPVHYAKLDPQVLQDLVGCPDRQQELSALVAALGRQGVNVIVGGIEDLHSLPLLWSCGIDYVQGFFLQPPHDEMSYDFAEAVM